MSWKNVKNRVLSHECRGISWRSEQKSLLYIIEKAKMFGLESTHAEQSTISNLRTIARKAYQAAHDGNTGELSRLFEMASAYNATDLRIALGKPREVIPVRSAGDQVVIVVDGYQAGVIAHAMRERFDFQMDQILVPLNGRG